MSGKSHQYRGSGVLATVTHETPASRVRSEFSFLKAQKRQSAHRIGTILGRGSDVLTIAEVGPDCCNASAQAMEPEDALVSAAAGAGAVVCPEQPRLFTTLPLCAAVLFDDGCNTDPRTAAERVYWGPTYPTLEVPIRPRACPGGFVTSIPPPEWPVG